MITLKDFMTTTGYKITEGSQYGWKCYGNDAFSLDYWNDKYDEGGCTISVIFDTKTQNVYEMQAWDYTNRREYRWINPDYLEAHKAEAKERNIDFNESIDSNKFIDLDVEADILEKATAIAAGLEYDTRVIISVDLPEDVLYKIMTLAHEADMTLNQFMEKILREAILEVMPDAFDKCKGECSGCKCSN